jgi:hypothetical protein
MKPISLYSLSYAARILETDRKTVAGVVKAHGLATHAHPSNARARAIDDAALKVVARALGRPIGRAVASS